MTDRTDRAGLQVATVLADFIDTRVLPGTGVGAQTFWQGFADLVSACGPKNRALLSRREELQSQIDDWHRTHRDEFDAGAYRAFLADIGYLVPDGPDFTVTTRDVDAEIARIAGPQLVVPITNARFALNAANARWGSLYDALYGTDALGDLPERGGYDPQRGERVIVWGRAHLDAVVPLASGSWADIDEVAVTDGTLTPALADPAQFAGFLREEEAQSVFLTVNGLHVEIVVNPETRIGGADRAGISDIRLESALSTIMDCEDSVACVDAEDKVGAYANWLGLMKGDLEVEMTKDGERFTRRLAPDRQITGPDGAPATLRGRALMLVRNVGHLMTTPAILDAGGAEIGEGLMDAMVTTAIALHDLRKTDGPRNSPSRSVYVVKPKMHGPEEVAFADEMFGRVEDTLGLARDTVKLGIMDEERRTSANLAECIRAAKSRVAFINTGFLDRTGDEIHTGMEAGPMVPKGEMKSEPWIVAYEDRNVDIGLACGLRGRAQIGKGMWAMPDRMAEMLRVKIGHPEAGANCAWVPSPTAATLHATHYHRVDVAARQAEIAAGGPRATLAQLLTIPVAPGRDFSDEEIARELENNAQGILGYVVRWVDQGVGCSKVPDIEDVALMEDRATCRISSQALANWLHHGVIDEAQVRETFQKMAQVVDRQNADDPTYRAMAPGYDGAAYAAALDLVLKGREQPSGYTEPLLHEWRARAKD